LDPADHNNNRDKDLSRKTVDLDKDLVDRSKIEDLRDLADHNSNRVNRDKDLRKKTADQGRVKDKDLVDRDRSLILDSQMSQRRILQHLRIRLRIQN
ncbi:MAG: hypothetical protein ABL870_04170, partial [Sediminibacterium sp.]